MKLKLFRVRPPVLAYKLFEEGQFAGIYVEGTETVKDGVTTYPGARYKFPLGVRHATAINMLDDFIEAANATLKKAKA